MKWDEHDCWALVAEVMRALSPERVDIGMLYATGFALGASGSWHIGMYYGDFLAAIVPMSGRAKWPGETWAHHAQLLRDDVQQNLERLAIRAYQIESDSRVGNPSKDMKWISHGRRETTQTRSLPGMTRGQLVEITVWQWLRSSVIATWGYWQVGCPLRDWPR